MARKVYLTENKCVAQNICWNELVLNPLSSKFYAEAISAADALIDNFSETILRQIYNNGCCQELINQLHVMRGRLNFDGMNILFMLKNKKIIDDSLYGDIMKFKQARNLVLHRVQGEYALVKSKMLKDINNQAEYDKKADAEVKNLLDRGFKIYNHLLDISEKIAINK